MNQVQVKICGLTVPEEAVACANAGADAIGLIFYPPSPRFVNLSHAKEICAALENRTPAVGVFVDSPVEDIILTARHVGLHSVQLHGNETAFTIRILIQEGLKVIKVIRSTGLHLVMEASEYAHAHALLVEASKGDLPGGNGAAWNWSEAISLAEHRPYILAGGLNASNIIEALQQSHASAVDLSSGVERAPGLKDLTLVKSVIEKVHAYVPTTPTGVLFS